MNQASCAPDQPPIIALKRRRKNSEMLAMIDDARAQPSAEPSGAPNRQERCMTAYRIIYLDIDDRIKGSDEFECAGDEEAQLYVNDEPKDPPLELWSGARVVAKVPKPEYA